MFSNTLVQISKKYKSFTVSSVKLMPLSSSFLGLIIGVYFSKTN
jgi:hypothetical protein